MSVGLSKITYSVSRLAFRTYKSGMRVEGVENIESMKEGAGRPEDFQVSDVILSLLFLSVFLAVL